MVRLAILLIGTRAAKRQWPWLVLMGAFLVGAGVLMVVDASSRPVSLASEILGALLVLNGTILLFGAWASNPDTRLPVKWRAIALIVFGVMIMDVLPGQPLADSLLFGIVFLIDGLLRIASALVVRFLGWRLAIAAACLEVLLAALILADWPLPYRDTIAYCMGLALGLSGLTLLRLGLRLRSLPAGAPIAELTMYQRRPWRSAGEEAAPQDGAARHEQALTVYVWTPLGSIEAPVARPVVSRYLVATDRDGVVSTGHAALELDPDVYISLYPAVDLDHSAHDFTRMLRAGPENDVPGRWNETHAIEVAHWRAPDQKVLFHRYNAHALRSFWQQYRQDTTYNLTSRSCSTVASVALEHALEGSMGHRHPWRTFGLMLLDPYIWLASMLRYRGLTMAWTPGLVLDYARALKHVQEREHLGRPGEMLRRWRTAWRRPAGPA